jgi:acyl carrier protein
MSTLERLSAILHKDYGIPAERLSPEATLTTLGLDSLSVLELMFKLEDAFGVKIDEPPANLVTIGDVVKFIDGLLKPGLSGKTDQTLGIAGSP